MKQTSYNYQHKITSPNRLCGGLEKTAYPMSKLNTLFKQHIELNQLVTPLVQQHASVAANVAKYQQGVLSLSVENHSTANHLRYVSPLLLAELTKYPEFSELTDITVFVLPNDLALNPIQKSHTQLNQSGSHTAQPLSAHTKMSISNLANRHIKNEKLKQALLTLAKTPQH